MNFLSSLRICVCTAFLFFPMKIWSAGEAIQFSVTLSTSMSYQTKSLPSGRYSVSVENREGQCRLEFMPIISSENSKPISIYGICGVDKERPLAKPVISLSNLEEANITLIYFETPYEEHTFYVVARLTRQKYQERKDTQIFKDLPVEVRRLG